MSPSPTTNQLTNMTGVSYDANGNMLGDGFNTNMVYDAANRLVSFSNGTAGSVNYVYDGNGLRVEKTFGSATTVYIFSGSKVIAEYPSGNLANSPGKEYVYSGGQLIYTADSSVKYHLRDHLSIRVNTDANGNIIGEQGHLPFGELWYLKSTTTKWIFTTYERDNESGSGSTGSGNDYAQARYYVNRLGRFMSPNPTGGRQAFPQSWNMYAYVMNNPINLIDPTGLDCVYLNDAGTGVDANGIDHNSSQAECYDSQGYWAESYIANAKDVQTFSDSDNILITSVIGGIFALTLSSQDENQGPFGIGAIPPSFFKGQFAGPQDLFPTMSDESLSILRLAGAEASHGLGCGLNAVGGLIPFVGYFAKNPSTPYDKEDTVFGYVSAAQIVGSQSDRIDKGLAYIEMPNIGELAEEVGPKVVNIGEHVAPFGAVIGGLTGLIQLVTCFNQGPK